MFPQIFGKYVLERPLAVGGMARVFLATLRGASGFEKKLVVKQIRAELATDDAFVRRFVDEAKTTVELSHPNIVPVYELGVEQGIYYLAMELCDGVTLAELLQKTGRLTPDEGAYLGIEICRALDYAHRKARVIHRDVTPRNVVIDEEGAVRLIDFGIAAAAYDGAKEVFGSPGHMPPEQLRGDEVGPPADVFAVATLLYETWSSKAPFRRRTPEQSQSALSLPVAPLSTFDPTLAPLDALFASALAMEPGLRPQSAEELSRPLRRFIGERDLGDLTRKVGARVRELRAAVDAESGLDLAEANDGATPVASETRTFATRSHDAIAPEVSTAPAKPRRHDPAPYVATRRMNDDASVRPARVRAYKGVVGMALGSLVVAVVAAAAWRYGEARTATSMGHGDVVTAPHEVNTAIQPKALESLDPIPSANEERTAPSADSGARAGIAPVKARIAAAAEARAVSGDLAHVRILANPMANVEIDGKPRGVAPLDVALPAGTHFIRLDCTALGEAVAQNVPVGLGENVTISGDFTGAHGRILVRRAGTNP